MRSSRSLRETGARRLQRKGDRGGSELHRLWRSVVEPVLEATRPAVILEIGASDGRNTEHLLEYCRQKGGVCHTVDPVPGFDVAEWQARYGDVFVFHRLTSLEALPEIPVPDVALIDGDHNWYTVFHELRLIEERARAEKHDFPVVILHRSEEHTSELQSRLHLVCRLLL